MSKMLYPAALGLLLLSLSSCSTGAEKERVRFENPLVRTGIQPDTVIHPTAKDVAAGKDEVLEAAVLYAQMTREKDGPLTCLHKAVRM